MYGMIHKAARELAQARFGDEGVAAIMAEAELDEEHFISAQTYSDEITMRLVGAIIAHSEQPAETVLEALGRYWVEFAAGTRYGKLMDMAGSDLATFLDNLDRMHDGVRVTMPDSVMPSFELLEADAASISVAYRSSRDGLEFFVKGLLLALMDRFGESGSVTFELQDRCVLFTIARQSGQCAA